MKRLRSELLIIPLVATVAIASLWFSVTVKRNAHETMVVKSSELAHSSSRYIVDFAALEMAAHRSALGDSTLRAGELQLRYDIASARADLLESGEMKTMQSPRVRKCAAKVVQLFRSTKDVMADDSCDQACKGEALLKVTKRVRRELAILQTEGFKQDAVMRQGLQSSIAMSVRGFAILAVLLTIFCTILAVYLVRRYRSVVRQSVLLEDSRRRLLQVSHYRANFLAGMSHEFRTPLNAIKGFSELAVLMEETFSKEQIMDYVRLIQGSAKDLETLTETILDLSKIDAGVFELKIEEVGVADAVARVVAQMSAGNTDMSRIKLDIDPDLSLHCDRSALTRCLINVLSNALKYSGVEDCIDLQCHRDGSDVEIRVVDHGCGISEDEQDSVWSVYSRSSYKRSSDQQGTGLGLAITRALVEAHGGAVALESELGEGTTVILRFPEDHVLADQVDIKVAA